MTIVSGVISPYFLIGYGLLILLAVTFHQYFENRKILFIFRYPDHELARLFVTNNPKLINKLHVKYGEKLTEKHSAIIALKND